MCQLKIRILPARMMENSYDCQNCQTVFPTLLDLLCHTKSQHSNENHSLVLAKVKKKFEETQSEEIKIENPLEISDKIKNLFDCQNCQKVFPTLLDLICHSKSQHSSENHSFVQLAEKFKEIEPENQFEKTDKMINPYDPSILLVENNNEIPQENSANIKKTNVTCQICNKIFSNPGSLQCHIKGLYDDSYVI